MISISSWFRRSATPMAVEDRIILWCLKLAVFLTPFFFLPFSTDPLELNKSFLFDLLVLVAGVTWVIRQLRRRERLVDRMPFAIPLALFLLFVIIATVFSVYHYRSLAGVSGYTSSSLASVFVFLIFFLLLIRTVRHEHLGTLLRTFLASGAVVVLFNFLQVFANHLFPWSFAQQVDFNAVVNSGSIFSLYLAILGLTTFFAYLRAPLTMHRILLTTLGLLTFFLLLVYDAQAGWLALILGFLVFLVAHAQSRHGSLTHVVLPTMLLALSLLGLFVNSQALLQASIQNDVVLPVREGAAVTVQSIAHRPFTGYGPGTFDAAFTQQRPVSFNDNALWNLRFLKASNEWFQMLTTLGVVAVIAFLALLFMAVRLLVRTVLHTKGDDPLWLPRAGLLSIVSVLLLSLFLVPWTFILAMLFWFVLGLLVVVTDQPKEKPVQQKRSQPTFGATFSLSALLILAVVFLYFGVRIWAADANVTKANQLIADRADIALVQQRLARAVELNGFEQGTYFDLARNLLAQGQLVAQGESPDVNTVRSLLTASIAAAQSGIDAYPNFGGAHEALIEVYQGVDALSGVQSEATRTAIETAIESEENNPALYIILGQYYLTLAQQQMASVEEGGERPATVDEALAKARTAFEKASSLKTNYIPAVINISLTARLQGDPDEAVTILQSLVASNPLDPDVLFNLGENYRIDGRDDDAFAIYDRIVSISPGYSDAHFRLGEMYEARGEKDKAIEQYEIVLDLNPDAEDVKTKLDELKG